MQRGGGEGAVCDHLVEFFEDGGEVAAAELVADVHDARVVGGVGGVGVVFVAAGEDGGVAGGVAELVGGGDLSVADGGGAGGGGGGAAADGGGVVGVEGDGAAVPDDAAGGEEVGGDLGDGDVPVLAGEDPADVEVDGDAG